MVVHMSQLVNIFFPWISLLHMFLEREKKSDDDKKGDLGWHVSVTYAGGRVAWVVALSHPCDNLPRKSHARSRAAPENTVCL